MFITILSSSSKSSSRILFGLFLIFLPNYSAAASTGNANKKAGEAAEDDAGLFVDVPGGDQDEGSHLRMKKSQSSSHYNINTKIHQTFPKQYLQMRVGLVPWTNWKNKDENEADEDKTKDKFNFNPASTSKSNHRTTGNIQPHHTYGLNQDNQARRPPVFIPYVGARALSNLHEFFNHVKENLIALRVEEILKSRRKMMRMNNFKGIQGRADRTMGDRNMMNHQQVFKQGDQEEEEEKEREEGEEKEENLEKKEDEKPISDSRIYGLSPIPPFESQSSGFLQFSYETYDPAWKGTNLGLGRRKKNKDFEVSQGLV